MKKVFKLTVIALMLFILVACQNIPKDFNVDDAANAVLMYYSFRFLPMPPDCVHFIRYDTETKRAEFSFDDKYIKEEHIAAYPDLYTGHFFVEVDDSGLYQAFDSSGNYLGGAFYIPYETEYNGS